MGSGHGCGELAGGVATWPLGLCGPDGDECARVQGGGDTTVIAPGACWRGGAGGEEGSVRVVAGIVLATRVIV